VSQAAGELGVPGAVVGVDHGGELDLAGYGSTRLDHGRPVDASTLFQIGSTAKTFTAAAMMALVDQGRVALDERVRHYLPDLRLHDEAAAANLTVGQLLNHTAGWDGGDSWVDTGEGDDAVERAVGLLAELPQQFAPGTDASYNNAAFVLAGRVIEMITGAPYERALTRLIIDPLGLQDTLTSLNAIMTRPFALGHQPAENDAGLRHCEPWSDPRGYVPAGARLASSLRDQLAWARFQLGDGRAGDGTRVLSETSLRAMHEPTTDHELMPGIRVGIGWMLRGYDGTKIIEHHGDVAGQHLSDRIVRRTLETRLGLAERPPEPLRLSAAELAPYAGTYRTDGIELRIVVADDGLIIHGTVSDGDGSGETLEFPVSLIAGERFLVVGGPFTGLQGEFVREGEAVVAAKHVGRLVPRAG
jgi:CubicO group peptidase (beta-lactamase class C family)